MSHDHIHSGPLVSDTSDMTRSPASFFVTTKLKLLILLLCYKMNLKLIFDGKTRFKVTSEKHVSRHTCQILCVFCEVNQNELTNSLTRVHRCMGYRNPNWQNLSKSVRLTNRSVYDSRDIVSESTPSSLPLSSLTYVHSCIGFFITTETDIVCLSP